MPAPSVVSKGTANAGTGASVAPSYPASIQAGDILWLLAISNQPVSIGVIEPPAGFTEAAQGTFQNSASGDRGHAALFWRRATGDETGTVSVTRTGDTGNDGVFFAQLYQVRGCRPTGTPYEAITARYGPGDTTVTWDAVAVSGVERTLLAFCAQADNASTVDPPTDYLGLATDTTAAGTDAELRLLYRETVSADGAVTATGGETEGWATFHVSLVPDADRRARVATVEVEVPTAPRRGRVAVTELEVPLGPRRSRLAHAELEAPLGPRRGRVAHGEFEVPLAPRRGRVGVVEFEVPSLGLPDRRARVAQAEFSVGSGPRRARVAQAEVFVIEGEWERARPKVWDWERWYVEDRPPAPNRPPAPDRPPVGGEG